MPFASQSPLSQIRSLRVVARDMLAQYEGGPFEFQTLLHGFNTTFRVRDRSGRKFALRINVNSHRRPEELRFETAWTHALSNESEFDVPKPVPNRKGSFVSERDWPEEGRTLRGVLYSWLPGADLGHKMNPTHGEAVGRAMRRLHEQAREWSPPAGCAVRPFEDAIAGEDWPKQPPPGIDYGPFREVVARTNGVFARMRSKPKIAIHNDVHYDNLKWHKGRLAVFDFDDCAMSWPLTDAFITAFYVRRLPEAVEAAFWRGLGAKPTDFGVSEEEFEVMVASRGVLLSNSLFNSMTASLSEVAERYAAVCQKRLEHCLATGRFDPKVANLT